MPTPDFNFLIYKTAEEDITVNAVIRDETIWLTQKAMAELFGVQAPAISKHLNNIYEEGELLASSTISKMEIVQEEGSRAVKRLVDFYNLDAIISVGYRINSRRATQFRIWATGVLKEYMVKGFAMDDDRLKQGKTAFGKDYFRELLERVRSIRASERRIWQQVTDIYAECSIDYDRNSPTTEQFYAMVQNRFHYAITHKTAAEIVHDSADHTKEHMGLTTWKNAPDGRILKSDVTVAKNYLDEKQIPVWIRHVVVPGITFQREELEALGRFLATLSNVEKLEVLPYHSMGKVKYDNLGIDYALKDTPQLTKAEAKSAESIILEAMRQARNV